MKLDTKSLDKDILAPVFEAFDLAGYQRLYVGGCVRNAILKCGSTDIDLATDATPSQMRKVADAMHVRVIPTGEDYGTLTFQLNHRNYEITTFRKDIKTYGRRALVKFGTTLEEDALRRDFTMNSLYLSFGGILIDPLGGIEDLTCVVSDLWERPVIELRKISCVFYVFSDFMLGMVIQEKE